ncbi:1-phosphofructokinase [Leptolyngbya sp. FACHB-671]|uniref:1-phosphofructokinase n=1 Tax=Leptolyngbya sp. FACHB-671 TaxID=2692812 RepID=UPI001681C3D0|nr:1-phosphofructokinase [Leptolyngbya sp. FACHB-671]MBD1870572.1 1-phosphofructokinase [Cyanobacteria bacterium FACHB-471]MBD2071955.1 1-phosphofructokinase [Leptolyngbya sp. FACHB-671]
MHSNIATITLNPAVDQTASISHFRAGEVNRVEWEQADPGGKGVNVASFLTDFGFSVSVSGFLGKENAELFDHFFTQKGIQNQFVTIPGKTRVNVKIIDAAQKQVTDINFPGQPPTESDIAKLRQAIATLTQDHDWFVLSGSVPAGLSSDIYGKLVSELKAQNKTVVLDASGESLRQAIPFAPYAIKPNIDELQELVGYPLEGEEAIAQSAQTLLEKGIHSVVVSMGAQGAIFAEQEAIVVARPPQIEVVSTVGAGDAMVSGFITGKLRGLTLADCARLATAFSIGALSQVGPRLPPPETVESYMSKVDVQVL